MNQGRKQTRNIGAESSVIFNVIVLKRVSMMIVNELSVEWKLSKSKNTYYLQYV
jgi:hypothetical protein